MCRVGTENVQRAKNIQEASIVEQLSIKSLPTSIQKQNYHQCNLDTQLHRNRESREMMATVVSDKQCVFLLLSRNVKTQLLLRCIAKRSRRIITRETVIRCSPPLSPNNECSILIPLLFTLRRRASILRG